SRRLRSRDRRRHRHVEQCSRPEHPRGARPHEGPEASDRRARPRAHRSRTCPAPFGRHSGTGAVPRPLRRRDPRPCGTRAHPDPAGGVPQAGHLLGGGVDDVPGRRLRGRSMDDRGAAEGGGTRAQAIQAARPGRSRSPRRGGRGARAFLCARVQEPRRAGMTKSAARRPVLSLRELNRAMLARQLLLGRANIGVVPAIERLAALQAQWSPSPYIALWSRLVDFRREKLWSAIERHEVIRARLMRGTLHLVSARDFYAYAVATQDLQRGAWNRLQIGNGVDPKKVAALAIAFARKPRPKEEALETLVWRCLAAFGPATLADIAQFAGQVPPRVRPTLERLAPKLRTFSDQEGRLLYDLPRAVRPGADVPAPVRFLPRYDELLISYKHRDRVIAP